MDYNGNFFYGADISIRILWMICLFGYDES
jgi:hypothetical protein